MEGRTWGWIKAVGRDGELSPMARLVAFTLAQQFANHETARCTPGTSALADALATSPETIKRSIRALEQAGWISRIGGQGRGRRSGYMFLSPGQVVPLHPAQNDRRKDVRNDPEKGTSPDPSPAEKGSNLNGKGVKSDPAYNTAKPKKNKSARAATQTSGQRPTPLSACVHFDSDFETEWNAWLDHRGYPPLRVFAGLTSDAENRGHDMPWRTPPTADNPIADGLARKFVRWRLDQQENVQ